MQNSQLKIRQRFDARMLFFYVAAPLFLAILAFHILQLQWLEHDHLALQSDHNRLNIVPVLPVRGEVVDRYGKGLAVNRVAYHLLLIPERATALDATLQKLAQSLQWSPDKLKHIYRRIRHTRPDRPVLLDDKLQWSQVSPIAARLHHLPGVEVEVGSYRLYPYSELTSHLIGYLSLARKRDLDAGFLANEFIGRAGVERTYEKRLHGEIGYQEEEVDARGRRVAVLKRTPPKMGGRLQLALDVELQKAASDALGDRTGAVVALDIHTGEVLTLLSKPGYNTNRFITGLEYKQWNAWLNNGEKPLLNRATQAVYPPASTFKLITGIAGLEEGAHLARGTTVCKGYLELADRKLRCWKRTGHGRVSLHDALVHSCDVYFYELADQLGMKAIAGTALAWGLGQKTGVDIFPEARGSIPSYSPNRAVQRKRWFRGETMITAIGQGAVTATPLQMARFVAAIANGGAVLKPQLLFGVKPEVVHQVDVKAKNLVRIQKAMRDVVADPHGTAHRALGRSPWHMAGKTGTAQVIKMAQGKRAKNQHLVKNKYKDHAWFVGYGPYEHPEVAFAVFVEHGGHGGRVAAPVVAAMVKVLAARAQKMNKPKKN